MSPAPDRGVLEALAALIRAFAETEAPAMIIGGIAVIARGVPRLTVDIDATAWGEAVSLETLFSTLETHEIVPRIPQAEDFARSRQILLLEHRPTGTPLDISLAWPPFEREALCRASPVDFGGVTIPVAQAEDLLVYKAVAWRDRDKEDVERSSCSMPRRSISTASATWSGSSPRPSTSPSESKSSTRWSEGPWAPEPEARPAAQRRRSAGVRRSPKPDPEAPALRRAVLRC